MDPAAALALLRQLAGQLLDPEQVDGAEHAEQIGHELAETFQGLDAWLSRAGALPRAWDYSAMRAAASACPARQHDDD